MPFNTMATAFHVFFRVLVTPDLLSAPSASFNYISCARPTVTRRLLAEKFSCTGPSAWNSLPASERRNAFLDTFKIKTFLFATYWHSAWNTL